MYIDIQAPKASICIRVVARRKRNLHFDKE
jgi:hypothetical protein